VRLTTACVFATLALTGASACGGDDDDAGGGGLGEALGAVSAGPVSETYFAYSDMPAIGDEVELPRPGARPDASLLRWRTPMTLGGPALANLAFRGGDDEQRLDVYTADRLLTIGAGGDTASRADGLDDTPDRAALESLAEAASSEDGTVVVATSGGALDEALGEGDEPLGDRSEYRSASDCLGDVVAAAVMPARSAGAPPDAGPLIAIGVRGGDDPLEVLCVVGDGDQARRASEALRAHLDPEAVSRVTNRHISDEVAEARFDTGDAADREWARVVVTPKADAPLGYLYRAALVQRQLEEWFEA
jgi:hypothetical protein